MRPRCVTVSDVACLLLVVVVRQVVLDMDRIHGDVLVHDKYIIYVVNGATTTTAVIGDGLHLSGRNQYVEMTGHEAACDGDLNNCPRGFTLRFKMRADTLMDSTHFVSSPFVDVYYRDGRLVAEVRTPSTVWRTSTTLLRLGVWYQVKRQILRDPAEIINDSYRTYLSSSPITLSK